MCQKVLWFVKNIHVHIIYIYITSRFFSSAVRQRRRSKSLSYKKVAKMISNWLSRTINDIWFFTRCARHSKPNWSANSCAIFVGKLHVALGLKNKMCKNSVKENVVVLYVIYIWFFVPLVNAVKEKEITNNQ